MTKGQKMGNAGMRVKRMRVMNLSGDEGLVSYSMVFRVELREGSSQSADVLAHLILNVKTMVVVPEDCVGMVAPWLSLKEAILAGSTSKSWNRVLLSDEAWEDRYELFWGDKITDVGEGGGIAWGGRGGQGGCDEAKSKQAPNFRSAFRARYEILRGLPALLHKWRACAQKVEGTTHHQRQQQLVASQECTHELIRSARLCRLVLRVVAGYSAGDKGACGVLQEEAVQRMLSEKQAEEPSHGRTLKKVVLLEGDVVAASSARVQINQEWKDLIARGNMVVTSGPEYYECIERGAMIISKLEDPDLSEAEVREAIDKIAEQVRARIPEGETSTVNVLKWMNRVLFDELLFRGNTDDYYCVQNSLLSEVLRRKTGIPISLSVLYMCVAWRLGVRLQGVDMPMHFVLMARDRDGAECRDTFIDVFGGGVLLSMRELEMKMLMMGIEIHVSDVNQARPSYFFVRMLRNLGIEDENRARKSSLLVLCLAQLVTILKDSAEGSTQFYEEQIDLYRWTGATRLLCP
ncbi:hypothetical protein GUITHDRAFT_141704 [Guillardia theta CCMP2712]|uniref:Protein SirB1 N-terminal domain-containing protein n=1 Tax=Guillardia theta (strain CCMP2712) TaxID=905079 RepID=L1IZJ6_GUITC|nr:hypothetical protein GUITHDRAFT_141704 [Guillardia theta CCMP2712]EKX41698.1 hypothetical protein GUITHDRAFT_141704 [Guillardia theta CCMP2712]|eukprot:XP_005828678.1 hypothetical protein GUITHDRAFT_141704 [Guillardia theta CCMP2712]